MLTWLDPLRDLNFASVALRLTLSMLLGGIIGIERGKKHRAAGLRTYMLVCLGAALTMLLSQYEYEMLHTAWKAFFERIGVGTDISRFGAQVINGIGFLGAGTIIVTGKRQVKGLTTAAGLWASACMGLAVGAGFYELVLVAFLLIMLCIRVLPRIELFLLERARNVNLYAEFTSLEDFGGIIQCLREQDVRVYQVEISHGERDRGVHPSAMLYLRLNHRLPHEELISAVSAVAGVISIEEL